MSLLANNRDLEATRSSRRVLDEDESLEIVIKKSVHNLVVALGVDPAVPRNKDDEKCLLIPELVAGRGEASSATRVRMHFDQEFNVFKLIKDGIALTQPITL